MAEPVITTGALLVGTTKAAVAMVPAIGIICLATYTTFKVIDWVDDKLESRKRRKLHEADHKGLNRYQRYLLEKQNGLTPEEAFANATQQMEQAQRTLTKVSDLIKANISIPVPAA